jgi:hypothetical protein
LITCSVWRAIRVWRRPSLPSFRRRSESALPLAKRRGGSAIFTTARSIAGVASAASSARPSIRRKAPTPALSSPRCAAPPTTPVRFTKTSIARAAKPKTVSASSSSCGPIALPRQRWQPISCVYGLHRIASIAYTLVNAMRRIALHGTQFADAAVATIRLKLLKLGARVSTSVRRIHFAIASTCPNQHELEKAYLALKRTFGSA